MGFIMPLYDYTCKRCGPFRDWKPVGEYLEPAKCPDCGRRSPRAVATPALGMDWQRKKAHSINEKSAHEPRVTRRRRGDPIVNDAHADLSRHRERKLAQKHQHDESHRHSKHAHMSNHPWLVRH
jgi:putative FmdB family regulatory protein